MLEDHLISLLAYKDLSSKSLKHNNDPERKVSMAAPTSKLPPASLHCQTGMDTAASTDT